MKIKQSVINTFERVGIDYKTLLENTAKVEVSNRFGYGSCETTLFVAKLVEWVYATSDDYENNIFKVTTSDFDRIRYFILDVDQKAYSTCID